MRFPLDIMIQSSHVCLIKKTDSQVVAAYVRLHLILVHATHDRAVCMASMVLGHIRLGLYHVNIVVGLYFGEMPAKKGFMHVADVVS